METLIAILLLGAGIWMFISPKSAFNFKARLVKNWGISMSATPKAFKVIKYLGLAVAVVGFFLYFS